MQLSYLDRAKACNLLHKLKERENEAKVLSHFNFPIKVVTREAKVNRRWLKHWLAIPLLKQPNQCSIKAEQFIHNMCTSTALQLSMQLKHKTCQSNSPLTKPSTDTTASHHKQEFAEFDIFKFNPGANILQKKIVQKPIFDTVAKLRFTNSCEQKT